MLKIMEDERLIVAIQKMIDHRISSLPIIDGEGRVVDVISKADLAYNLKFINITDIQVIFKFYDLFLLSTIIAINIQEYFHRQRVTECISHRQPTIFPSADHTVGSILDIVLNNRAKCIFVTDSAKHLLAAISLSDFISYILCHEEVPDTTV
ncbi:unnamed protein product [Dracunculus medinensis]|uniref:CBS domain-containing protein n=1 Tax=Dracunculus medinensis TaxID=318479 RepID=A0A3P7QDE0_DRAME|nr:unnamed protein product [Dracunculus medinensis]